jgi:hypothetical protein
MKSAVGTTTVAPEDDYFDDDEISVWQHKSSGVWGLETLNRQKVVDLAQEKCKQTFTVEEAKEMLRLRDIRVLIPDSTSSEPVILVRMLAFLVGLSFVRALILWDRILVFVPSATTGEKDEVTTLIHSKLKELSTNYESISSLEGQNLEAFELYALEAVLWAAVKVLERDHSNLTSMVTSAIRRAKKSHSVQTLDNLRRARESASRLLSRAEGEVKALTDLTMNDHDMALMSFSNVLRHPEHYKDIASGNHSFQTNQNIDMMLEAYIQQVDAIVQDIRFLIDQVEIAQSSIVVQLDIARNKLLKVDNAVNAITSLSETATLIVTILAMNLNSNIQQAATPWPFWIVTGVLFVGLSVLSLIVIRFVNRLV